MKHSVKRDMYHFLGITHLALPKWLGPVCYVFIAIAIALSLGWLGIAVFKSSDLSHGAGKEAMRIGGGICWLASLICLFIAGMMYHAIWDDYVKPKYRSDFSGRPQETFGDSTGRRRL